MDLVSLALLIFHLLGLGIEIEGLILNGLMNLEIGLSTVSLPIEPTVLRVSCLETPGGWVQVIYFRWLEYLVQ